MDTQLFKHIDWTQHATYKDIASLLLALHEGFNNADVSSGSDGLVDGYVKRGILERLEEFAKVFDNPEHWLVVRPERDYTYNEGHRK